MTRLLRCAALLGVVVHLLAASVAEAQTPVRQPVQVRGGDHDGFGRLVFDWPEPVRYRAFIRDARLHLEFERSAQFDTEAVFPALRDYVGLGAEGPHGFRITFPLKGRFGLEGSTDGSKVVIDLADQPNAEDRDRPQVRLRVGEHDGYDRLVFDWPEPVGYSVSRDADGGATLRFERGAALDLSAFAERAPARIRALEAIDAGAGAGVALDLPRHARLRHFTHESNVVIDVLSDIHGLPQDIFGDFLAEAGPEVDGADSASRRAAMPPRPRSKPVTAARIRATVDHALTGQESLERAPSQPGPPTSLLRTADGDGMEEQQSLSAEGGDGPRERDTAPVVETGGEDASAGAADVEVDERFEAAFPPSRVARGLAPWPGAVPPGVVSTQIPLPWAGGSAAAYARGGSTWVVVEGTAPAGFAERLQDEAGPVNRAEIHQLGEISILELETESHVRAHLLLDGGQWRFDLVPRQAAPAHPLEVETRESRVLIPAGAPGPVFDLDDPGGGGKLYVVPLAEPGRGMAVEHRFPEFALLPTTLGVAVVPFADHLRVEATEDGIVIDGGNEPLMLSAANGSRDSAASPPARSGSRLFDLPAWRREDLRFSEARQILQDAVVDAPPDERHLARLDLARFYFAHGLATEALGALDVYAEEAPRRRRDPQVRLMEAASQFLAGDWARAGRSLAHPALDQVTEALPWRAAYAAASGANEAAVNAFHASEHLLTDYPPSVLKRMYLWAAQAHLALGEANAAEHKLDAARPLDPSRAEEAEIEYLTARRRLVEEEIAEAEDLWRRLSRGAHGPTAARARLVMAERDLAAGRIDRDEAIAELERLRFAWRGDAFEAVLLDRLADLYLEGGHYRQALTVLRDAATHLSDSARTRRAATRMRNIFSELFLDGKADAMPPLQALALYESFRELTPAGARGDEMIERLVDRLVGVDLLERAASLLETQVRHRLDGVDKVRVGARLASIYLLDRKSKQALEALVVSEGRNVPGPLRERRRHLRARALGDIDEREAALALLEGDASPDALRLKADLHRDAGNWSQAAEVLAELLPNPPPPGETMGEEDAQMVLHASVAMTLAERWRDLSELDARYGAAMAQGPHAQTFRLLAGDTSGGIDSIAQRLAGVEQAQAFMSSYRDSLRQQASLEGEG